MRTWAKPFGVERSEFSPRAVTSAVWSNSRATLSPSVSISVRPSCGNVLSGRMMSQIGEAPRKLAAMKGAERH